jgi:hypothetical protein
MPMISGIFQVRSLRAPAPQCMHVGSAVGVILLQPEQTRRAAVGSRWQTLQAGPVTGLPQNGQGRSMT